MDELPLGQRLEPEGELAQARRRNLTGDAAGGEDQPVVRQRQLLAARYPHLPALEVDVLDAALQDAGAAQRAVQGHRDALRVQTSGGDLGEQRAVTQVIGRADHRHLGQLTGQNPGELAGGEEPGEAAADDDDLGG
jgi:hypothetical protein